MALDIIGASAENRVEIDPATGAAANGRIVFMGRGNRVTIGAGLVAHALNVEMGDDCSLDIGAGCHAGFLQVHMRREGAASIGPGSSFNGQTRLLLHEPGRIDIGAECLFGPDVDVTVSDMHSVIDLKTGQRINPAQDVAIGDRVWLGIGVFVAKGARIEPGAVVGARSFVSGHVPANSLVAGTPTRVLREDVTWSFELR